MVTKEKGKKEVLLHIPALFLIILQYLLAFIISSVFEKRFLNKPTSCFLKITLIFLQKYINLIILVFFLYSQVGILSELQYNNATEIQIGGTLLQKISSCLQVLDTLLSEPSPIVSSIVVAEKTRGATSSENVVEAVASILGKQFF